MSAEDKRKTLNPKIQLDSDEPMHDPINRPEDRPPGWTMEEINFYFGTALKVLNKENFTTAKEYVDLLVTQCLAEKHWSDAFTLFLTRIKEMGLEIETDQDFYRKTNHRLFMLRTTLELITAAGLVRYQDEIMKYEIAQQYAPPPPMLPPVRVKEVPVAVPRRAPRAPAPARESILNPKPKPRAPVAATRPPAPKPKEPKVAPRFNKPPAGQK